MLRDRISAGLTSSLIALALGVGGLAGCAPVQPAGSQADAASTADSAEAATDSVTSAASVSPSHEVDMATDFPSWSPQSASLAKLVAYVLDVSDPLSSNYVEPEERIATFDMDGTLICEKAPVYVDYCMLIHRVLDDPSYQATDDERAVCEKLRGNADRGIVDDALDADKNRVLTGSFAGSTQEEVHAYVRDFVASVDVEGFDGMTYGESGYRPMLEVLDFLRDHDFDLYLVTACEREVARPIAIDRFGFAPDHVIGTDWSTRATGQGDEAANKYTFAQDDEVVFDGTKLEEVAKLNKVIYIERQIGRRPLLAFGNSSGDYAMLNYAQANPEHPGMGLLVLCDDDVREYGDLERAEKQAKEAAEAGWTTFSMADDWTTIYGEGVTRTELPADAKGSSAATSATEPTSATSATEGSGETAASAEDATIAEEAASATEGSGEEEDALAEAA